TLARSLGERLSHVKDHLKVTGVERPTGLSEAWDTDLLGQFPSVLAKVLVGVDPADPKLPQPPGFRLLRRPHHHFAVGQAGHADGLLLLRTFRASQDDRFHPVDDVAFFDRDVPDQVPWRGELADADLGRLPGDDRRSEPWPGESFAFRLGELADE